MSPRKKIWIQYGDEYCMRVVVLLDTSSVTRVQILRLQHYESTALIIVCRQYLDDTMIILIIH